MRRIGVGGGGRVESALRVGGDGEVMRLPLGGKKISLSHTPEEEETSFKEERENNGADGTNGISSQRFFSPPSFLLRPFEYGKIQGGRSQRSGGEMASLAGEK